MVSGRSRGIAVRAFGGGFSAGDYLSDIAENFKFRYLGLGFLWAWIYCTWFTPVLFPESTGLTVNNDISWFIFAASVMVTLFVMSLFVRHRDLSTVPVIGSIAGPATTLGAIMMAIEPLFGISLPVVSFVGAALTGVASGWLWMLWGEFTGKVDQELAEMFVPFCVAVPLAGIFTCTFVTGPLAGVAVCCLPLVSGWLFNLSIRDTEVLKPVTLLSAEDRPKYMGDFLRVGLGSLSIYTCLSFAWGTLDYATMTGWGDTHLISYIIGAALAIVVAVLSILYLKRLDLFALYRWLIPVILIGLALLAVESFWARFFSLMLVTLAQYGFDIIVWIYFSRIARKGVCSGGFAIGINRGFVQAGCFTGSLIAMGLRPLIEQSETMLLFVVLILSGVMTSVVLMVLNRKDEIERMTTKDAAQPAPSDVPSVDYEAVCDRLAETCGLTAREREILGYLARGRSLPYIRETLILSKNTVSTHAKNLYKKLGIHSRQDLFDLIEQG